MCFRGFRVLLVGLVISDFSLEYASGFDVSVVRNVSLTTVNGTIVYRSPLRISDQRNRTSAAMKNRGAHDTLAIRLSKKHHRQRLAPGHMSDQQVLSDPLQLAINGTGDGSKDTPTESEVQLRRALRQKRRKLKRLWQEIDHIQRTLKSGDGGRQQPGKEPEDGKGKTKTKNRKSHWRRRMMQRLKLLSRQLQEQQQRSPSMDTVEKLYALLALEPMDGPKNGKRGNNLGDGHGRRPGGRRPKKHRGHLPKGNSTVVIRGMDTALPGIPTRSPTSKHGTGETGNRTMHQVSATRHRLSGGGGAKPSGKTGSIASVGRIAIKKGEAGSACTSHKNCKPGFCCHQTHSVKASSANSTNSVCVEHRLKQGQPCANSCQCDNGLQCFISRKDKLYHKRLPPPDTSSSWSATQRDEGSGAIVMTGGSYPSSSDGQCKIPAMDDVLHGTYIIGEHALFKSHP